LAPAAHRDKAVYLPAWFPEHVNNHDVRLSSAILCILGIVSSALVFSLAKSARWIVFVMMIDQLACVLAGPLVSPIGAIAMTMLALKKPNYVPGACKQITALIGCVMTGAACIGFFLGYTNSTESVDGSVGGAGYSGCAIMAVMSIIWLVEMCYGVEVGKRMLSCGFRWRILPLNLYRMHTRTRQEAIDTWIYRFTDSDAAKPVHVESGSRENPLKLKYKKKVEEWSKDDFDPIRHIRITYFAMPASIAGLALTFKIGGSLNTGSTISLIPMQTPVGDGIIRIQDGWFQAFSSVAAFIFIFMMFLYLTKALLFFDKVKKEWFCPQQSSSFGYIFISCMIFGFLLYNGDSGDDPESDSSTQVLGRVLYWIGAVSHAIFSIIKIAEWICRRLRLDHVHANWTLLSVGLALAGFCTPIVGALAKNEQQENGNAWLGRFYVAFSQMVFTPIYVITFYKLLCFHNSDHRERHGWWLWVAAQCMLGLSEYTICEYDYSSRVQETILATPGSTPLDPLICGDRPVRQVAGGVLLFLMLCCATLPRTNFFFRDEFNMNYWIICFSLDILSAAASFFYTTNGWYIGLIAEMCTIVIAGWAHAVVFMHTLACLIRKHGVCTSADKWGPLSLIRIVHQAMRGNIPTLQFYLSIIDLDDASPESRDNLGLFAAHFNRFRIIHEEHSLHDEILFTAIRELFPRRGRKCEKDHRELNSSMMEFSSMINMVLDPDVALDRRKEIVSELKLEFPLFLKRYERHLLGEEYDMLPIGEKYIPVSWAVELVREMWKITPPEKWEGKFTIQIHGDWVNCTWFSPLGLLFFLACCSDNRFHPQ
jgi:tellurite resistance protein TehA-like permease